MRRALTRMQAIVLRRAGEPLTFEWIRGGPETRLGSVLHLPDVEFDHFLQVGCEEGSAGPPVWFGPGRQGELRLE